MFCIPGIFLDTNQSIVWVISSLGQQTCATMSFLNTNRNNVQSKQTDENHVPLARDLPGRKRGRMTNCEHSMHGKFRSLSGRRNKRRLISSQTDENSSKKRKTETMDHTKEEDERVHHKEAETQESSKENTQTNDCEIDDVTFIRRLLSRMLRTDSRVQKCIVHILRSDKKIMKIFMEEKSEIEKHGPRIFSDIDFSPETEASQVSGPLLVTKSHNGNSADFDSQDAKAFISFLHGS